MNAKVEVDRVLPSGGTEVEPARRFFQERLGLWAFWVFALSSGFYLINIATWPFLQRSSSTMSAMLLQTGNLDHLAASLLFGGVWLVSRRMTLSLQALRRLEIATAIVGCTIYALMGAAMTRLQLLADLDASVGLFAGLLAAANTVLARAIIVPSTPARTLVVSVLAMAPLVPATYVASGGSATLSINIATWAAVSIAIAVVGSRIIFGLRSEAARVRRLGQYTLEHRIGAGGMGVVYRASHAMLRRPTAIKLLPANRAGEAGLARFEREVQMTAQLSHPNTVAVYDYGRTPDGVFYYAMEFLDGLNLEDLVRRDGPQPPGRVISILTQVCGALSEAHAHGLVHRDIKPANIILTERGGEPDVAKVVDFGLVRPLAPGAAGVTASTTLTGTPLYMSPEAMTLPESPDPRSDLYALGAVGYYLLTGRPVFEGRSVAEVIGHHLHTEPVPPSHRVAHVPADLEAVIMQCLRKPPDERPATARDLRDALRACTMAPPWDEADASTWWKRFRAAQHSAPGTSVVETVGSDDRTIIVTADLDERLTRTVAR